MHVLGFGVTQTEVNEAIKAHADKEDLQVHVQTHIIPD